MKAVLVEQPGSSEQLKVVEREIPKIKEGWSLVKIKGFGINHSEIFTRKGGLLAVCCFSKGFRH